MSLACNPQKVETKMSGYELVGRIILIKKIIIKIIKIKKIVIQIKHKKKLNNSFVRYVFNFFFGMCWVSHHAAKFVISVFG